MSRIVAAQEQIAFFFWPNTSPLRIPIKTKDIETASEQKMLLDEYHPLLNARVAGAIIGGCLCTF